MSYNDAMLDIETLSTHMNAVVLSIGVVLFDLEGADTLDTLDDEDRKLYMRFFVQPQIDLGRHVSADTLNWWMTQNRSAQVDAFVKSNDDTDPATGLVRVANFVKGTRLWGNGAGFDLSIVRDLAQDYHVNFPISHRVDMDLRTLRMLAGNPPYPSVNGLVGHNPVDDCKYQILCAQSYWRSINGDS